VIIDSTWESVALSVISQLTSVIVKFNAIAKICKYRMFHEGHHFISMAMDVHDAPEHDMDHFIRNVLVFSMIEIGKSFILVFLHSIFQASC